jgi:hypothetical protein
MTSTWGEFIIQEEIGRGSFGGVYKAFHPTLRQPVALKLIPISPGDTREIERALDESRRLASVHHNNVVSVHDARYADGHVGICMELVNGETLAQVVERRGRLGPDEVLASAVTLCNALSAIHAVQIVHNDVKAQNVVREDGGRLVLMDFGAGRRLRDPDRTTGLYFTGTPVYMAPEIFRFEDPSPVSDIYSLGVLLFFLLTATHPVHGGTMEEIARKHLKGQRRYLGDLRTDLPERLLAVVDRALEPRPADRYQSCGELLHDLMGSHGRHREPPLPRPTHVRDDATWSAESGVEDASGSGARSAREWLGVVGGTLAVGVLAIWLIGFLGSKAHRVMFGVRAQFDLASPLDWLVNGLRTLPLPVFSVLMALTVYLVLAFVWRLTTRMSDTAGTWSHRTSRRILTAKSRAGLDDPAMADTVVLIAQVGLLLGLYWSFADLITAITTPLANGPIAAHARLAPEREYEGWLRFCQISSVLALAGAVTWSRIARRRQPGQGGVAAITAGFAMTAVFAAMATVPRQIVNDSYFTVATYGAERCYVIEGNRPDVALLLCPWRAAGRSVVVNKDDPGLTVHQESENVYSAVAARLQAAGGT